MDAIKFRQAVRYLEGEIISQSSYSYPVFRTDDGIPFLMGDYWLYDEDAKEAIRELLIGEMMEISTRDISRIQYRGFAETKRVQIFVYFKRDYFATGIAFEMGAEQATKGTPPNLENQK